MSDIRPERVTARLAQFVVESRWSDIPTALRHEAKRSILNHVGCALGSCRDEVVERALAVISPFSGPRAATVVGRADRMDIFGAAYLNAISSNVLDFDDTHVKTVIHPTATVAPPLLAWSEHQPVKGADLLHAFILGVETACRIGNAVTPWHYSHGFHITSTCGVFGAAAATGRLLGLDTRRMTWALGNAATQACGLVESLPVMAKSLAVGNAARNGLLAALLGREDFSGAEQAIEGTFGFARVTGQNADLTRITNGLGETWELPFNAYKPYPTGVVLHPVIDACLHLREQDGIRAGDIEHITVRGHALLRERADRPTPAIGREGKLSIHHCCAVAFLHGKAGLLEFTDDAVKQADVLALRAKVSMQEDTAVGVEEVYVTVRTRDGRSVEKHIPHLRGSMAWPMSDAELETKFLDQAAIGTPGCDAKRVIDALWGLEECGDVAQVMKLMVPAKG